MASIDQIIAELERLSPDQVDEVARIIRGLSGAGSGEGLPHPAVPAPVVAEAVQHGWPEQLFTELIGGLPDLNRATQPPIENRADL